MTPKPTGKFWTGMLLWLTVFAATGCDVSMPTPSGATPARTEKMKMNLSPDEARELAQPASGTPGLSVDVQNAQNMGVGSENFDGSLQPSKGLNTQRLFNTPAGSEDERFERLEAAVQSLRDDFDKVNPAINRLMAIEGEIQMLVDQLQVLVKSEPDASLQDVPPVTQQALEDTTEFPVEPNPAPSPPIPLAPSLAEQTAAPAALPSAPAITPSVQTPVDEPVAPITSVSDAVLLGVRVADHDKTTRVVFETNKNIAYSASVDPEKILLVTFTQGASSASLPPSFNSKLVKSADQTPQASGGFIVAMPLAKMTKVVRQGVLQPDATNPNYRIYIDLEK